MKITTSVKPAGVITRGTTCVISASFTDVDGTAVEPNTIVVDVNYPLREGRVADTLSMEKVGGTYQSIFQSAVSDAGCVFITVEASSGDDRGRADSKIRLVAGAANPSP